jgi:hypothetical protein
MPSVRFKEKYSNSMGNRLSYELVSDEPVLAWEKLNKKMCLCYATKLLGNVAVEKMEPCKGDEVPAIDIFIELTNKK